MSILTVISEKQLIANRENGKKGGVKTFEGREISKYNAFQHGILSKATVLRKGDLRESEGEFRALCAKFYEDVQPVGMIEQALLDKLIMLYWRERRVVRGERASLESSSIGKERHQQWEHMKKEAEAKRGDRGLRAWLTEKEWREARRNVEDMMEAAKDRVLPFGEYDLQTIKTLMLVPPLLEHGLRIIRTNDNVADYAAKRGKSAARSREIWSTFLLKELTELAAIMDRLFPVVMREHKDMDSAWRESQAFSFEEEHFERFQRYESHLHRMFMQTLHELQRVQSVRLGRPGPLAAALDMTLDS